MLGAALPAAARVVHTDGGPWLSDSSDVQLPDQILMSPLSTLQTYGQ